ncbi:hypothetical protein H4R18_003346 [Coemansia javaensis]|uniref:Sphingomyelin synthase-like domain-containing protein n=1 Tax=Coemansia javaensis TaxID=2761396 RepID=A0A9W8HE29_9FUNG|nr:hypothetical protein H4R18_003346 [Coemansia javaensis]
MALAQALQRAGAVAGSQTFVRELARLLAAWATLLVVGVWMVLCQQWSDMRWAGQGRARGPALLRDIVLERLPVLEQTWVADRMVGAAVIGCLVGCSWAARGWRERMMVIRRMGWMVAVLYLARSLTISVTTVPPSAASCKITVPKSAWDVVKAMPDILSGAIGQCTDKVFSGHTAIFATALLFWRRYAPHWGFVAASAVHTLAGVLAVLMARYHYTIDVLVGLVMACSVHHVYYAALARAVQARVAAGCTALDPACYHQVPAPKDDALGEYDMTVFAASPSAAISAAAAADDSWRDHDSVLGVDVSGRQTPVDSVMRKRETSAGSNHHHHHHHHNHHQQQQQHHHHGITVAEPAAAFASDDNDNGPARAAAHPCLAHLPHAACPLADSLMGTNHSHSALLPAIVAWMDGLDIRIAAPP